MYEFEIDGFNPVSWRPQDGDYKSKSIRFKPAYNIRPPLPEEVRATVTGSDSHLGGTSSLDTEISSNSSTKDQAGSEISQSDSNKHRKATQKTNSSMSPTNEPSLQVYRYIRGDFPSLAFLSKPLTENWGCWLDGLPESAKGSYPNLALSLRDAQRGSSVTSNNSTNDSDASSLRSSEEYDIDSSISQLTSSLQRPRKRIPERCCEYCNKSLRKSSYPCTRHWPGGLSGYICGIFYCLKGKRAKNGVEKHLVKKGGDEEDDGLGTSWNGTPWMRGGSGNQKGQNLLKRLKETELLTKLGLGPGSKSDPITGPVSQVRVYPNKSQGIFQDEPPVELENRPMRESTPPAPDLTRPHSSPSDTGNCASEDQVTKVKESEKLPDIYIRPCGISKWIQRWAGQPADPDPTMPDKRTQVVSSFEEEDSTFRVILEDRYSRGLAKSNVFYYLLGERTDLRLHINKKTGEISRSSTIVDNDDDYELMRSLAVSFHVDRYWILNMENIACGKCVEEIQHPPRKMFCTGISNALKGKSAGSYRLCSKYYIHCSHNPESIKFFEGLSKKFARCIRKLRLVMEPNTSPDPDVMASAIDVVKRYLPALQEVQVEFPYITDRTTIKEDKVVRRMVGCLKQLENHLPRETRLRVLGLQHHAVLSTKWNDKRRKWHVGHENQ